jgi:hypothetical protein
MIPPCADSGGEFVARGARRHLGSVPSVGRRVQSGNAPVRGLHRRGEGGTGAAMLSGFNTNLRHRGVVFHVQTEDSGRAKPHIISHLFHGGNILASRKQDYGEMLDAEELPDAVRGMMESQHKEMLRSLIRGDCDEQIVERLGSEVFSDVTADTQSDVDTQPEEFEAPVELMDAIPADPQVQSPSESSKDRIARAFGDGVVSQKPLDEVVLDYLVENARKRKRPPS